MFGRRTAAACAAGSWVSLRLAHSQRHRRTRRRTPTHSAALDRTRCRPTVITSTRKRGMAAIGACIPTSTWSTTRCNRFLAGNHVVLTDRATRCLTDFSLDFERHSSFPGGPDMSVSRVLINGQPARFAFVQPTYPGDPKGQDDPNPLAHQAAQNAVVGGPAHNPLPPACSPQLPPDASADAADGTPCPANKLVITPTRHISAGGVFTVTVFYTGRPGVHEDGDGTTEGWFRSDEPAGDGGSSPPSRSVPKTGCRSTITRARNRPTTSTTRSPPVAPCSPTGFWSAATATDQARSFRPARRPGTGTWPRRWRVTSSRTASAATTSPRAPSTASASTRRRRVRSARRRKQANRAIMDQQPDITAFQSRFNGPYPFASAGVVVGRPDAGFEEEMEGMITFAGGPIDLDTLNHENMHQWWGDHVTESNYDMTFFKEGLATLGEFLFAARKAADSRRRSVHPRRCRRVQPQPDQPVQRALPQTADSGRHAVGSDALHAVLRLVHLHAARPGLHRVAADPRRDPLHRCPAGHPAAIRRRDDRPNANSKPASRAGCRTRTRLQDRLSTFFPNGSIRPTRPPPAPPNRRSPDPACRRRLLRPHRPLRLTPSQSLANCHPRAAADPQLRLSRV